MSLNVSAIKKKIISTFTTLYLVYHSTKRGMRTKCFKKINI